MTTAQNASALNTAQTIASVGFDISNFTAPDVAQITHKVDLVHDEDGNAIAGYIIVGKNSREYQNENHAIRAEGYQKSAIRKTTIDVKTEEGASKLVDTIDSNSSRLATAVVVGWWGFTSGGVEAPLDKAMVRASYVKYPTWEDKVSNALEVDANFLKVSSPASLPTPTASLTE
ncbi:hypothetical protein [Massilia antarctica]|uniref:hypothetical protein n=1 Tax=Massilia antarctica TaxID=2765360 RepID=UPI002271D240|nr:hypothetical protein [Massilia sp. H27-R4]MCY0910834.1 hypothetical protein [Massilia sp. H27-R4]